MVWPTLGSRTAKEQKVKVLAFYVCAAAPYNSSICITLRESENDNIKLNILRRTPHVTHPVRLSGCNGSECVAGNFSGPRLWQTWYNDHVFEAGDWTNVLANCCDHLFN